jgi:hypothetical protein
VCLPGHHAAYLPWAEFVQTQERLRNNWQHEGRPGVAREGTALLQGIVFCGVCGGKMSVHHPVRRERRSPTYLCDHAYRDGAARLCQSMTARPVDAAVRDAFLAALSPLSVDVSLRVLDHIEHDLAAQRHQRELQLDHVRYEARLAQRQYDAVDPDNRLVAGELERRWNEKLARVAQLERAYAHAEQEARWTITAEERAAIGAVSADLPAIWHAATTTNRERKQLLRFVLDAVDLDGVSQPGQIIVQLRWRSGTITTVCVARTAPGDRSLRTADAAVALIGELAPTHTYAEIARHVTAAGWQTAFGRGFTSLHVGYLCRRHGWGRGQSTPVVTRTSTSHNTQGDGHEQAHVAPAP